MEHEAIYNLYPSVKHIEETNDGNFVAKDENDNEVSIDMSAVNTKAAELQAVEDAKPSRKELQASAKAKLIAGEALTEDEANTIVL
tara:strand:+ start:122 stop:379 length:258 start_codon:yes stop_codon:yes gene_type:complete